MTKYIQNRLLSNRYFFAILLAFGINQSNGQTTYTNTEGGIINDMLPSTILPTYYKIEVEDAASTLDSLYGLEKVCLHIKHKRPSDLKLELIAPDGTGVWLSNRNGNQNQYGYLNTCFVQDGFDGPIHQGTFTFKGEYSSEGRLDYVNNNQNPNGVWLLLITDLKEGIVGKLDSVSLFFGDQPAYYKGSACDTDNISKCKSSDEEGRLLPDLIIAPKLSADNLQYFGPDDKLYPNQLRFAAAMANIGEGPLEIVTADSWYCGAQVVEQTKTCRDGSAPTNNVRQVIYKKTTNGQITFDTLKSGVMYFDDSPGHNHYHVKNWANFKLLKKRWWSRNPKYWKTIASSNKISYCLFDNKICTKKNQYCQTKNTFYGREELENYGLGKFSSCSSRKQGISVGGIDYYGLHYEGQHINLPSDIKSGKYYLWIEVDPSNEYLEINEENNHLLLEVYINN